MRDYRPGTHYASSADSAARQNRHARAYPDVVFDDDRAIRREALAVHSPRHVGNVMTACQQDAPRSYHDVSTDMNWADDKGVHANVRPVAKTDAQPGTKPGSVLDIDVDAALVEHVGSQHRTEAAGRLPARTRRPREMPCEGEVAQRSHIACIYPGRHHRRPSIGATGARKGGFVRYGVSVTPGISQNNRLAVE